MKHTPPPKLRPDEAALARRLACLGISSQLRRAIVTNEREQILAEARAALHEEVRGYGYSPVRNEAARLAVLANLAALADQLEKLEGEETHK
jgi:hypothetical protein